MRYLKTQNKNWYNSLAGFCFEFNLGKSTCLKVISQAFLDDAKVWSDTGKKHAFFVTNEFAD